MMTQKLAALIRYVTTNSTVSNTHNIMKFKNINNKNGQS